MIRAADFLRDLEQVSTLIAEYVAWLDCDLLASTRYFELHLSAKAAQ